MKQYMKYFLTILICAGTIFSSQAQQKYWILFQDKGDISQYEETDILSPAALENRVRQGIELDMFDYPVNKNYRDQLKAWKIEEIRVSKWLNGISAYLTTEQLALLQKQIFVKQIRPVGKYSQVAEVEMTCDSLEDFDQHTRQITMLELNVLHDLDYTGRGVRIAVFDNGFRGVDSLAAFQHVFEGQRMLATKDYVDNDEDVFEDCGRSSYCKHGTNVFSILAARQEGQLMGSAPDATYILLRTENDSSETHQEEDNWLAAAEFADSLGAQVFTTSLGYFSFDAGEGNYATADMDGETAIITNAADMAASRGIIVINSSGNSGANGISAPADGNDVIAIGSVDQCEEYSSFSSQGPTADGRIKPDVTAMGQATFVMNPDGQIRQGSGTSFSCPLVAGFMACLLQASPNSKREDLYKTLIQSADRFQNPDNLFGYGVPSAVKAFELLLGYSPTGIFDPDLLKDKEAIIYPNPTNGMFFLSVNGNIRPFKASIELIDSMGRRILQEAKQIEPPYTQLAFQQKLATGIYHIVIYDLDGKEVFFSGKILVK